jgi:hypothetical protein
MEQGDGTVELRAERWIARVLEVHGAEPLWGRAGFVLVLKRWRRLRGKRGQAECKRNVREHGGSSG